MRGALAAIAGEAGSDGESGRERLSELDAGSGMGAGSTELAGTAARVPGWLVAARAADEAGDEGGVEARCLRSDAQPSPPTTESMHTVAKETRTRRERARFLPRRARDASTFSDRSSLQRASTRSRNASTLFGRSLIAKLLLEPGLGRTDVALGGGERATARLRDEVEPLSFQVAKRPRDAEMGRERV